MNDHYSPPALVLHWLMAILIAAAFFIGLYLHGLPLSPWKFKLISWHKWIGISVLALVVLRILVRLTGKAPPLPSHMSRLEQGAAHLGHLVLYLLMIAVPLTGWAMSSAYGIPVVFLGRFRLPDLISVDPVLAPQLMLLHAWLNWTLAALVVGHVLVALKHHFIDRDGLLDRMRPGRTQH
jgi:cytochrome b561